MIISFDYREFIDYRNLKSTGFIGICLLFSHCHFNDEDDKQT